MIGSFIKMVLSIFKRVPMCLFLITMGCLLQSCLFSDTEDSHGSSSRPESDCESEIRSESDCESDDGKGHPADRSGGSNSGGISAGGPNSGGASGGGSNSGGASGSGGQTGGPEIELPAILSKSNESFTLFHHAAMNRFNAHRFVLEGTCLQETDQGQVVIDQRWSIPCGENGRWAVGFNFSFFRESTLSLSVVFVDGSTNQSSTPLEVEVPNYFICPPNFVGVRPLDYSPYSIRGYGNYSFCVAKYEMRQGQGSVATSQPQGLPWLVSQPDAVEACQALGPHYDLISNDKWQAVALDIYEKEDNWIKTPLGERISLNWGNTFEAAHPRSLNGTNSLLDSTTDNLPGVCGLLTADLSSCALYYPFHKRTHTLTNGEIIWDLSGNALEWVKDRYQIPYSTLLELGDNALSATRITDTLTYFPLNGENNNKPRNIRQHFGSFNRPTCDTNPRIYPICGLGTFHFHAPFQERNAILRGGHYTEASGIFYTLVNADPEDTSGFRCTYTPPTSP